MTSDFRDTPQRKIWSDPYFYIIFGVVGGAYVVLILAMLLADTAYIFNSDMTRPVSLDFAFSDEGTRLNTGETVSNQFDLYGLTITSGDQQHPPIIINSGQPSAANSDLGTPHVDFGGPGIGQGGRNSQGEERNPHANHMPLGNVLAIAAKPPPYVVSDQAEIVVNWVEPVRVSTLEIDGLDHLVGRIEFFDRQGEQLGERAIDQKADDGKHQIEVQQDNVSRMVAALPESDGNVGVGFLASGQVTARLSTVDSETLKQGNVYVVPSGRQQLEPNREGGRLTFEWADPIQLDGLTLLNVDRPGGRVTAFNEAGDLLTEHLLSDLGENSVQAIEYKDDAGVVRTGQQGVARLDVELPCGAAVAELDFTWTGRVRAAWERERPRIARLFYNPISTSLAKPEIQYSIKLSLISCTITAILSLWVAIPVGYLLSRHEFPGRNFIDAVLDIPIVLPPLVVGISLLILFKFVPQWIREQVVYQIPAVILAQFAVACAFAVRTMRATFDQIDSRREQVALTLGCSRFQAFGMVVLPEASRGVLTAGTLAWARALGEFGPLLIFAGATRNKTEVLSTTVFLEISIGDLGAAVAVSLIMVVAAVIVLIVARLWGSRSLTI